MAEHPIKMSKSSRGSPEEISLAFSFAYNSKEPLTGTISNMESSFLSGSFEIFLPRHSAMHSPKSNSALVISEIQQFSKPHSSILSAMTLLPRNQCTQMLVSSIRHTFWNSIYKRKFRLLRDSLRSFERSTYG